jgi:glycolate oxidase FAD binding subunit
MTDTLETASFIVDGTAPQRVLRPSSIDQVSEMLAECHSSGESVIPWGGGTRMHVGNVPTRYTTALDMRGVANGIEHEPGDLTLVTGGSATVASLSDTLASAGQRLPFDVANPETATIGGSVASNAPGHSRTSMGGIRDWIIGMKVVHADGTATKSGGRVVKNVQGYDVHRLHTGAFGTLGVIVEVAFKVIPIPARSLTAAISFDSIPAAGAFVMETFNGPSVPEAMTLFTDNRATQVLEQLGRNRDSAGQCVVLARVAGGDRAVSRAENDLKATADRISASGYELVTEALAAQLWMRSEDSKPVQALGVRVTLKPSEAIDFLTAASLGSVAGTFSGELYSGFGTVALEIENGTRHDIDRVRQLASRHKTHAVIERCPVDFKSDIDVFGDQGTALTLMRSVKQRFDPNSVLNPGRFAGRI